jgi:hypothetical protein
MEMALTKVERLDAWLKQKYPNYTWSRGDIEEDADNLYISYTVRRPRKTLRVTITIDNEGKHYFKLI